MAVQVFIYLLVLVLSAACTRLTNEANNQIKQQQSLQFAGTGDCVADVQQFCKGQNLNNFAVLQCLTVDVKDDDVVSDSCQHLLWQYKYNLTTNVKFEEATTAICRSDLNQLAECSQLVAGHGLVIPCLIYYIDNVTSSGCREFLSRMEIIVFSDYQLIYKFADACSKYVKQFSCGRIAKIAPTVRRVTSQRPHEQGSTLSCLVEHISELDYQCQHEILRVAELQADDFHKDRQLYFACREDRERFCPKVAAGEGNVYKCLYEHKFSVQMSSNCRDKLTKRQSLQQRDYKVNRGIITSCQQDIDSNNCQNKVLSKGSMARMSDILVCLENAFRNGYQLQVECKTELNSIRRSLLEDYKISPELVDVCDSDISTSCTGTVHRDTLHCLMNLAKQNKISQPCRKELVKLLKTVNIGEDYSVDPILQDACDIVVKSQCSRITPGQARVYECLMSVINKPVMTSDCKTRLLEVQYFIAREFKLRPKLFALCTHQSACKMVENMSSFEQAQLLYCLHISQGVSAVCRQQVKLVLAERAKTVDLEPEVEDSCRLDLSHFCLNKTAKNEEMDCLEENLDQLKPQCKTVVEQFIEQVEEMPEFDSLLAQACQPFWQRHCKDYAVHSDNIDTGRSLVMTCLINNKNHRDMKQKCRIGIEHHQLISMSSNFKLSPIFREACQSDVEHHCPRSTKKMQVIECLSSIVRNDSVFDRPHHISLRCRQELTFERLQRSEDVVVDPELHEACKDDIRRRCNDVTSGKSKVIECLRSFAEQLKDKCHEMLFKREEEEAEDPTTDFILMSKCKRMIKKYCLDEVSSTDKIFTCLVNHKEINEDFDEKCSRVLVSRLRVRAHDIRLNPALMRECQRDITVHCKSEFEEVMRQTSEGDGKVLFCLRRFFTQKQLTASCQAHVAQIVKESVLDYVQDIRLAKACSTEIKEFCAAEAEGERNDQTGDKGQVEECLKRNVVALGQSKLHNKCLKELVRSLAENKADIHLDPVLFRACAVDLTGFCRNVVRGEGRQMSCLMSALDDQTYQLQESCRTQLRARIDVWSLAVKIAPPDNFRDLLSQVYESSARSYLLTIVVCVIVCIFIGGLFCGRVTKRIARQLKNK